ncbi:MAG: hypothetical protein M1457_05985 [bacterium]|nr:hypothetical protein [bacterium]
MHLTRNAPRTPEPRFNHRIILLLLTGGAFWCLAAGGARGASLAGLFTPGIDAEVWTFDREAFPLKDIQFDTPRDFARESPGRLYRFTAAPDPPDFSLIQKIVHEPLTTEWLGSRPEAMEYYRLGDYADPVPPPPDWRRAFGQSPPWKRPVATTNTVLLPFLNHAIFCWANESEDAARRGGGYLFRQSFKIDQPGTLARAVLRLATNGEPVEMSLNEYPLHLAGNRKFSIAEFEVTPLIQPGANILAVHLRQPPGAPEMGYGLAFNLKLTRQTAPRPPSEFDLASALLVSEDGDRVWGRVIDMRGDGIRLDTPFGDYSLSWDDCRGLLFPGGWHLADGRGDRLRRSVAAGDASAADPAPHLLYGLPVSTRPTPLQDCLLLTQGRLTTAKPSYVLGQRLYFEGVEGKQYTLPMNEVLGVYPPRPVSLEFKRPKPAMAQLFCRVTATSGERLSGLLRELNGRRMVLESASGDMLGFDVGRIGAIQFPYHYPRLTGAAAEADTVALLPQVAGQETYRATYLDDVRRVETAAFALGAPFTTLEPDAWADPARLTPASYPVVVSVDPVGEYLETLGQPGDAAGTLASYVRNGGRLIVLSRGGAFRTAVRNDLGTFRRQGGAPDPGASFAARQWAVLTIRPADPQPRGIKAFDHPPNTAEEFFFQRQGLLPEGLHGLPRRIPMASMISAPFFPMIGRDGQGTVVYSLTDTNGAAYGPALSLLPAGKGYVVVIDHLLWDSGAEDTPFSDIVLPLLLRWAMAEPAR